MFLNDLYTVVSLTHDGNSLLAEIRLNAAHHLYDGHFPGAPVTPGVVQLQIVKEILGSHLQKKLQMRTMRTCKFLQIINPQETPVLQISIKFTEGESIEVVSSGSFDGVVFFKAQVTYFG